MTSTVPAAWAGVVAITAVALTIVTWVAAAPPKDTAVAPVRAVPVIVMLVPPAIGPAVDEMPVMVGTAA